MKYQLLIFLLQLLLLIQDALAVFQQVPIKATTTEDNEAIQIDLNSHLNNRGASGYGSNFDGAGTYYKCPFLSLPFISMGTIDFKLSQNNGYDNVVSLGQSIPIHNIQLGAIYLLGSVSHGPITTHIVIVYQDGSQSTTVLNIPDWQVQHAQQIDRFDILPCQLSNNAQAILASIPLVVDPSKSVSHLILPYTSQVGWFKPALHLFGITAVPAQKKKVKIVSAKGTRRWWENSNTRQYQMVTVKIHNTSPNWVSDDLSVFIEGSLLKTKYHGNIKRLAPGHVVTVEVAILTLRKRMEKTQILVEVVDTNGKSVAEPATLNDVEIGLEDYDASVESLGKHTTPSWYQSSKFGIFIHWGVYSIPSWAPVGGEYAEWYWYNYNQKFSATYKYHRAFYGPDFEYDDFIAMWKPNHFDPLAWLDLINASGAKYFVFTSKHHDGIALFDTKVSDRSTVKMNPHRDFVKELLDAAKSSYPHLKRGIYFSLPEWFHPSYHDNWLNWNGPPKNPYTGHQVSYTGAPSVTSFVNEVQVPQFLELFHNYEPDIMWCDIGGINNSTAWQAEFLNEARKRGGRQVTMNDRCGNAISDFATVEYQGVDYVPERPWESTRGIDPHSFGFNHQTKPYQYASTVSLLRELVTTIAKGGNFLLNMGPEASGLLHHVMVNTLLDMGRWINKVHEAIFDTVPYWVATSDFNEPGQPLYFLQSKDGKSIYLFSLERPQNQRLIVHTTLPLHSQSKISLMTKNQEEYLDWRLDSNQRLVVDVLDHVLDLERIIWVFKIEAP